MRRIRFLVLFLLFAFGLKFCEYSLRTTNSTESKIIKYSPIGATVAAAKKSADNLFGEGRYHGHMSTRRGGRAKGPIPNTEETLSFTYKIATHPSWVTILKTHVYATWYFESGKLIKVEVKRQIDGI